MTYLSNSSRLDYLTQPEVERARDGNAECSDEICDAIRAWLDTYYPETKAMPLDWAIGEARRLCSNDIVFWDGIARAQEYDESAELEAAAVVRVAISDKIKAMRRLISTMMQEVHDA